MAKKRFAPRADNRAALPPLRLWRYGLAALATVAIVVAGLWFWRPRTPARPSVEDPIGRLDRAEEAILELTPSLKMLARDTSNFQLPGIEARALFGPQVELVDLEAGEPAVTEEPASNYRLRLREWPVSTTSEVVPLTSLNIWDPLVRATEYFERTKFYFIEADLDGKDPRILHAKMGFDAVAQLVDGHRAWLRGKMHVTWRQNRASAAGEARAGSAPNWRIVRWQTDELVSTETADPAFFEDRTLVSLEAETAEAARASELDSLYLRVVRDQDYRNTDNEDYVVSLQWAPGVSVVDLNQDGYDDLYITKNWGRALFLQNRGDGTFEERSAELGLAYENHLSCSLFADFDNDGDADAIVGRTLRPSLYLENVDGKFVERTALPGGARLPALTSAICAADYNGDGLLDVYFSTYANRLSRLATSDEGEKSDSARRLMSRLMGEERFKEMLSRVDSSHLVLDRLGPGNTLLVNRGNGRFEVSPVSRQMEVWRNTFQATWCDFDGDGDPDLYVANDYASNNLFRNDGRAGFTDITSASNTADIGFGMGASWGDYENDGRPDLYVSNMYSKAGRRITSRVDGLDPRFALMARGNSLFRNLSKERFEKVSGVDPPALLVENSGWAWSGQFLDVDNDGFQDIHSLAGNITFPDEVAFDVDL